MSFDRIVREEVRAQLRPKDSTSLLLDVTDFLQHAETSESSALLIGLSSLLAGIASAATPADTKEK